MCKKTSVRADFQHPQPGINSYPVFAGMSLGFFVHTIFLFFTVLDKLSKYVRQYSNERPNAAFYRFPVQLKDIKQIWTEALFLYFFLLFSQLDLRKCVFLRTSQVIDDELIHHHDMF